MKKMRAFSAPGESLVSYRAHESVQRIRVPNMPLVAVRKMGRRPNLSAIIPQETEVQTAGRELPVLS